MVPIENREMKRTMCRDMAAPRFVDHGMILVRYPNFEDIASRGSGTFLQVAQSGSAVVASTR